MERKWYRIMGLAASQARLLSITMRITDDEYQLMKLSAQQMNLRVQGEDLADEYEYRLGAASYTYNFNIDGKNTAVNFNYSDVMGAGGIEKNLESPVMISDAQSGRIVLNGTYGMAAKKAGLNEFGNAGSPTADQFNAFMSVVTSDSETDWYSAAKGLSTSTNNTSKTINNSKLKNATQLVFTDEAKALRTKYDEARAYVEENFGEKPTQKWVEGSQLDDYDIRETVDDNRYDKRNNRFKELKTIDGGHYQDIPNSKFYTLNEWNKKVKDYCTSKGLESYYVINGGYPKEADATTVVNNNISTDVTPKSTTTTTADETTQKKAKFYYQVFEQAFSKGYMVDEQITNRSYMNAQFSNNKYKIGGAFASENVDAEKMKLQTAEDVHEEETKITRWYEKESKEISNQEKDIDNKMTALNAEISALNTEKESVNTLIQKNIERSFTYCQNG